MSEPVHRPYPVTIVGRLAVDYDDGQTRGAAECAIPADRLQDVIALIAELQARYPQL